VPEDDDLAAFVAAREQSLLRLGWLLTADADEAQDLVQEALARVLPRWRRIAPGARESYVRATMRTLCVDRWRRRRGLRIWPVAEVPDGDDGASGGDGVDAQLTLRTALRRLTPRQRAVLVLRFYEDLSELQTAQEMQVSVGTVKSQTKHALDRLRILAPDLAEAFGRSLPPGSVAAQCDPDAGRLTTAVPPIEEVQG
jgi:RNA polymerase sigma-70 factor (sigma-E family)